MPWGLNNMCEASPQQGKYKIIQEFKKQYGHLEKYRYLLRIAWYIVSDFCNKAINRGAQYQYFFKAYEKRNTKLNKRLTLLLFLVYCTLGQGLFLKPTKARQYQSMVDSI